MGRTADATDVQLKHYEMLKIQRETTSLPPFYILQVTVLTGDPGNIFLDLFDLFYDVRSSGF